MPRYSYRCETCEYETYHFHNIDQIIEICPKCNGQEYKKMLNKPLVFKKQESDREPKIGSLTKKYIESNREVLKEMKKESKDVIYEPS